jgi:Holliday junction resolvase RusA-like endonuclease
MRQTRAEQIRLTILGPPRTKAGKARVARRGYYLPKWVTEYEDGIRVVAAIQLRAQGVKHLPAFGGRVRVAYDFYYAHEPTTADLDNALKSVNDALQGVVYRKDCDIWRFDHVEKHHDKMRPRIEIEVAEVTCEA